MWSIRGGANPGPAGTYYHGKGEVCYFWNAFDQVLVRPALLDALDPDGVAIPTRLKDVSLLTPRGRPDANAASDHLPLAFSLNL